VQPTGTVGAVETQDWLSLLWRTADEIRDALDGFDRWGDGGDRPDQYALDQVTDARALTVLTGSGVRILSEESGLTDGDTTEVVIIDPVDGSTNASRRIPHYCTSLCVVDDEGPLVGLVVNLASGEAFSAVRGGGATLDDRPIQATGCERLREAIVALAGWPKKPLGAAQFRSFGAAALDLCSVACGRVDGYIDPIVHHGVWDYAAGVLICEEAGATVTELRGRPLIHLEHKRRLGPVAGATAALCEDLRGRQVGA
jgi:myo-inositol-1(or 4)-monophosphatase